MRYDDQMIVAHSNPRAVAAEGRYYEEELPLKNKRCDLSAIPVGESQVFWVSQSPRLAETECNSQESHSKQ